MVKKKPDPKKQKYIVTIKLETTDQWDGQVLDRIEAMFQRKPHYVTIRNDTLHGRKRVKQFNTDNLIEIDVAKFDYRERHYMEEARDSGSIGIRFKEPPRIDDGVIRPEDL